MVHWYKIQIQFFIVKIKEMNVLLLQRSGKLFST